MLIISALEAAYVEGLPYYDQFACIEVLEDKELWEQAGLDLEELEEMYTDDERTDKQVGYALREAKENGNAPDYIVDMLNNWKDDGF